MPALADIRQALADTLAGLPTRGLQVSPKMLANPNPPTLQVMGPEEIEYHTESMDGARWRIIVQGFVPGGIGDIPAQEMLDGWLDNEGATSVSAAIEADPTLGGIVDDLIVRNSRGYQVYVLPGGPRIGTDWEIDIYTS